MSAVITTILSICIFYILIIWFFHKASIRFHKMDKKAGNTDNTEINTCRESRVKKVLFLSRY
jgi:hypothetical protein